MKTVSVELTERELDLLIYVLEGASAKARRLAREGKCDWDKTNAHTKRLCEVSSKFYQSLVSMHIPSDDD